MVEQFTPNREMPNPSFWIHSKSHYLIDVVHFLTNGKKNLDGAAQVHVLTDDGNDVNTVEFHTLTFDDLFVVDSWFSSLRRNRDVTSTDFEMSSSYSSFLQLWKRRLSIESQHGLMGNLPISNPLSSTSSPRCDHGLEAQSPRQPGCNSSDGDGPQRSSLKGQPMAVLRKPQRSNFMSNKSGAWKICRVCGIRVIESMFPNRSTSLGNEASEWTHDDSGPGGTSNISSNGHGAGREPGEDYDGEGRCRDPNEDITSGVREAVVSGRRRLRRQNRL